MSRIVIKEFNSWFKWYFLLERSEYNKIRFHSATLYNSSFKINSKSLGFLLAYRRLVSSAKGKKSRIFEELKK